MTLLKECYNAVLSLVRLTLTLPPFSDVTMHFPDSTAFFFFLKLTIISVEDDETILYR